ncbi:hypothetical protein MtrunA17_Chr5g0411261 [Medicago truncatula]|uniref:Uncharacterized protein n=1 Tax=Medicago truncatula TaxID=3880 RepID=G7KF26_MEDTR|nr:hypothetical protein MTR_5g030350 [Medicago truncatula]RHN54841.1 hypothetical protein MtrunA17_Chr5g0411261 [Medicago truncatula]
MPFPVPSSVVTIVSICTRILKINAEVFFLPRDKRSHENDLPDHDLTSTGNTNKHVVVVMDAMTEFSTEPLQRALDNVVTIACAVTLLGSCHVSTILVVPHKKIVMGCPVRRLVVEQIVTLCPSWVVFDR